MKPVDKKKIVTKIAEDLKVSNKEVIVAVNAQFSLVNKVMREGNLEAVRLPYLGKFQVKNGRVKHLTDKYGKQPTGSKDRKDLG